MPLSSRSATPSAFLKAIGYEASESSAPLSALSVLQRIFEAAGQKHLMQLAQLRKLWLQELDPFLTQNTYPRNFSVTRQFTLTPTYVQQVTDALGATPWTAVLQRLEGRSFPRPDVFFGALRKGLKRHLTEEEQAVLRRRAEFRLQQVVLHLTVYDGSIAQAIRFEEATYLRLFHQHLPGLQVDAIRCHVGDLAQTRNDQEVAADLAERWQHLVPPEWQHGTMPAFVHRVSPNRASLVVYVASAERREALIRTFGLHWLQRHLHAQDPSWQQAFQRVSLMVQSHLNPEQVRGHTRSLAGRQPTSEPRPRADFPSSAPPSRGSVEERFQSMMERMRQRASGA